MNPSETVVAAINRETAIHIAAAAEVFLSALCPLPAPKGSDLSLAAVLAAKGADKETVATTMAMADAYSGLRAALGPDADMLIQAKLERGFGRIFDPSIAHVN